MGICSFCDGEGENLDMSRCIICDGSGLIGDEEYEEDEPRECYYCHGSGEDELDEMGTCRCCEGKGFA